MDNSTIQRVQDAIQRSKTIAVAVGKNPSVDEMAAALSTYLSLHTMGKTVTTVSASEPIVELSNLVGINKVTTQYEGGGADLVVSFPYREGEIEKVSYTIENGYLNIVVKAGEQGLNFTEQDVRYTRDGGGGQLDLLIVVGTQQLSDVQNIFGPEVLKNVTIINIDNKQENQGFGDIVLVSPRFSSVSEQVTQLLSDIKAPVDTDIAQNLLDGILYATQNFQSPATSYLAFEMAGILMRQGAIRTGAQAQKQRQNYVPAGVQPQQQQPQQRRPQPQMPQQSVQDRGRQPQFNQQRSQQQQSQNRFNAHPQQSQQQRTQPQPVRQAQPEPASSSNPDADAVNPPTDWLTPKVYKGSTNI